MTTVPRQVRSSDGVALAVYETGEHDAPVLLLIHGYPDNHAVWDGVTELLRDRFRVVSYDVRGAGGSDKPGARGAYRLPQLVEDVAAVADAVSPDVPVHVLAHDWGSIQAWAALLSPELAGRIASLTSISGPSLDYTGAWLRELPRHPAATLRQLAHSYYMGLFQLPGLAEAAIDRGVFDTIMAVAQRGSRSARAVEGQPSRSKADMRNGLQLYRANILRRTSRPTPVRTDVPVQLVVPRADAYVTPALAVETARPWVDDLTVNEVAGGHWVVSERPDVIARLVREFVDGLTGDAAHRAAPQRRGTRRPGTFGGQFVVVTGGARGIGRATALEFARQGADVLIADIDDVAAKQTLGELREFGVQAWSEHLDVGDVVQWERFAASVRDEHGVPDVVVNNAGIGMSGTFLGTSPADWSRILNINLWSVIHGCRLFAAQQVERGQGGRIVNIASAAAYSPSVVYPAYATTKAAVLMLTECLRPELARDGITVTAICPGFVDSDISATTQHVGVDEDTAAALREHQIRAYRRRGYSPAKVARQVVAAAAAGTPVARITPEARALSALTRFAPPLARRLAGVDLNKL